MKLFDHQIKALNMSEGLNHVAYFHDCGLGKTYTGAEKAIQLNAKVNLVICQKSKVQDWIEHFKKNYPQQLHVLDLTKSTGLVAFFEYQKLISVLPIVGVINYDLVWRRTELLDLKDFTLMLDESSMIQHEEAVRTKFILNLNPTNVILLSGTPTSGKYENLWSQIHLLNWKISKELFLKQYVEVEWNEDSEGNRYSTVTGYKNIDRLKRKLAEHGCQFLKTDEVIDLPEQNYQTIKVPVSAEYKTFHKKKIVTVHKHIEVNGSDRFFDSDVELIGDTSLTKMLGERELCGIYSKEKYQALTDLISSTNDRLIIFYNFTAEYDSILRLNTNEWKRPLSVVNGSKKDLAAYEDCDDSITLIQYQAGAKGLNLQKANKVIYFTPTLRCEDWIQSQKRIHRIGQSKPCFYYLLVCSSSVEERIYSALELGVDYNEELFRKEEGYEEGN